MSTIVVPVFLLRYIHPHTLMALSALFGVAIAGYVLGGTGLAVLAVGAVIMLLAILALWNSVRSLTGDLEIEPRMIEAQNVVVSSRSREKERILRALKDLENERDLGKLDEADFKEVSHRYREEAKALLRQMDEDIAPYREKAEALAKKFIADSAVASAPKVEVETKPEADFKEDPLKAVVAAVPDDKLECAACKVKNDPDAKFCKSCAAILKEIV
jgi:hypothetical protein